MVMLVQKSRRPRRWAGVASFAVLLVALWWIDTARVEVAPPEPVQAHPPEAPGGLTGLGPSFSNEPITATDADPAASAPANPPR